MINFDGLTGDSTADALIGSVAEMGLNYYAAKRTSSAAVRPIYGGQSSYDQSRGPSPSPGGVTAPPSASPATKTMLIVGGLVVGVIVLAFLFSGFKRKG